MFLLLQLETHHRNTEFNRHWTRLRACQQGIVKRNMEIPNPSFEQISYVLEAAQCSWCIFLPRPMNCGCLAELFLWCTGHHRGSLMLDVPGCTHGAMALCRQRAVLGHTCCSASAGCLRCFAVWHSIVPCLYVSSITSTNKQIASEQQCANVLSLSFFPLPFQNQ